MDRRARENRAVGRDRGAAQMSEDRLRLPGHRRHRRRVGKDRWRHAVVLRGLRQRLDELGAAGRPASRAGVGHRVRGPVRVTDPADRGVSCRARRKRAAYLAHARGDVVQVERRSDRHRAAVLVVFRELVPLVVHLVLVRESVALVVHEDRGIEDAFAKPAAPVLELLGVGASVLEAAGGLRSVPVGDQVGRDSDARPERGRLEVDPAHDPGDLIAAPLRPLRVSVRRRVGAPRLGAEARDRGRVVSPGRYERAEVAVRVADAVEVDAVDVVRADDARRHVGDPGRRVGVAGVEHPVIVELREAVRSGHDPIRATGGGRSVQVEDVVGIPRRRRAVPNRIRGHPGMDLDALPMGGVDERLERIESGCDGLVHRKAGA